MKIFKKSKIWLFLIIGVIGLIFVVGILTAIISAVKIQQSMKATPEYKSDELYSKAVDLADDGDYKQAEIYLEQALAKNGDMSYRHQLAVVKYRLGKYQESIDQYKMIIDSGNNTAFAWNGIGNAYRDWAEAKKSEQLLFTKYSDEAISAYEKTIESDPGYVAAYSNLAMLYQSRGDLKSAVDVLAFGITKTQNSDLARMKAEIEKVK